MSRGRIRLSRRHKAWVYATYAVLLATGALWWVARTWLRGQGEFGETASPLGPWAMRLHGAAAMVFLVVLGTLLHGHVRQAWNARRSRGTGGVVLALVGALVASGYGLYYLGDESARQIASVLHQAVGVLLPALLVWHVVAGRRAGAGRALGRGRRKRGHRLEEESRRGAAGPRAA
jgi:cation transport ATPase